MRRDLLRELLQQNRTTCNFALDRVATDNSGWRLTPDSASIGFIYRHLGETINLFGTFFGEATDVTGTTLGAVDVGEHYDFDTSRELIERGYTMLARVVEECPEDSWYDTVDTPFFGPVSRARLFAHVLYHNAHHCGQLAMCLNRGGAAK